MSYNITVYDEKGEEIFSMNWLRNPFGLIAWAEANTSVPPIFWDGKKWTLYKVLNEFNYDKAKGLTDEHCKERIARGLFIEVINKHWEQISELESGYFKFNGWQYINWVEGIKDKMPKDVKGRIEGIEPQNGDVLIPQEHFIGLEDDFDDLSLNFYKAWFFELVQLSLYLKHPGTYVEISN